VMTVVAVALSTVAPTVAVPAVGDLNSVDAAASARVALPGLSVPRLAANVTGIPFGMLLPAGVLPSEFLVRLVVTVDSVLVTTVEGVADALSTRYGLAVVVPLPPVFEQPLVFGPVLQPHQLLVASTVEAV